jgi:putative lipoic acid-binding regulatory protein
MKNNFDKAAFKDKLEASGQFPMLYMFKFIVPAGSEGQIGTLFPKNEMILKPSSGGKYISTTIQAMMDNADEIIDLYEKAATIEGVISL